MRGAPAPRHRGRPAAIETPSSDRHQANPSRARQGEDPLLDASRLDVLREMGPDALPLVERIIVSFLTGSQDSVAAVRQAIDAGDPSELTRVAHKLRGSASTIGADRVSGICQELEQRGHDDRTTRGSQALLAPLEDALNDTAVLLRGQLRPAAR